MGSIIDTEMNCIAPYTLVIYCWRLLASITYKIKKPDGALKTDAVDGYFQLVALNNYERGISRRTVVVYYIRACKEITALV